MFAVDSTFDASGRSADSAMSCAAPVTRMTDGCTQWRVSDLIVQEHFRLGFRFMLEITQ